MICIANSQLLIIGIMKYKLRYLVVLLIIASSCHQSIDKCTEIKDLSGTWKFQLDPDNMGLKDKWFSKELNDSIQLPGTTDENKKRIKTPTTLATIAG